MELLINLGIVTAVLLSGVRIIQDNQRVVVYRFGKFRAVKGPGIYWLFPFFERQKHVDIRTKTIELRQQAIFTKDGISIKVKAVLWYKIVEPKNAITKVFDYNMAVYQYSRTAIRNAIGTFMLDEVLMNRAGINESLRLNIQHAAEPWGVLIELLDVKEIEIPEELQKTWTINSISQQTKKDNDMRRELKPKTGRSNYLLKEMERLPATPKVKRELLTSDHWY